MMYDELVKRLRNCLSDTVEDCAGCPYQGGYKWTYCMNGLISEAADAIEQLCQRVPQIPHGDLIDRREAIIDANERAYDFWLSDDEVNATIQFLNEQTTIIKAEDNDEI